MPFFIGNLVLAHLLLMHLILMHLMLCIWSWFVWGESIRIRFGMSCPSLWFNMPTLCSIAVPIVDMVLFDLVKPALNSLSFYLFSLKVFLFWSQNRHEISAITDSRYWVSQPFSNPFDFSTYFSHRSSVLLLLYLLG